MAFPNKRLNISNFPPSGMHLLPDNFRTKQGNKSGPGGRQKRVYTALDWSNYFEKRENIVLDNGNSFCVYSSGSEGAVCVFLHGGGYSALTWSLLAKQLNETVQCRCVAIDFRGHGLTNTSDDLDLSATTLSTDVSAVLHKMFNDAIPPIILIGHSMGGAIAIHIGAKQLLPSLVGISVIDVVEGTAIDALTCMQSYLRGRPTHFTSVNHAIKWSISTGQTRNLESARVSMPGQIKLLEENESSSLNQRNTEDINECLQENNESEDIDEVNNEKEQQKQNLQSKIKYGWRIDLSKTDVYWRGWFDGLSNMFLSCQAPKLLLLAGIDRLDKELIVGQMQGKFQMQVLPQCGHAVQEDVPDKVADVISTFLLRQKLVEKFI